LLLTKNLKSNINFNGQEINSCQIIYSECIVALNILKKGGIVNFKTDDDNLFEYTLGTLEKVNIKPIELINDVHNDTHQYHQLRDITTHYEKLFAAKGRTIKYCKFTLDSLTYTPQPVVFEHKISINSK
jgi:hypothetical protein